MNLGDLTAAHIGRTIRVRPDAPARVISGVRHYTVSDPEGKKGAVLRQTSVMLGSTGAKDDNYFGEHIGASTDEAVVGNG